METNEKEVITKKKSNKLINILIFIIIFVVSIVMYAKYVGTKGIVVKEYRVASSNIPESFSGVKIVFFSDTLIGNTTFTSDIKEIVDKIDMLKPDIVIFGGNLVREDYKLSKSEIENISEMLDSIETTIGKYSIKGDLDNKYYDSVMEKTNFIEMNNSYEYIYNKSNSPICLVGVGSYNLGEYKIEESFSYSNSCYSIMVTHEGDIINKIVSGEKKPDLVIAGNSLGGEVHLPYFGPVVKYEGSYDYYLDKYEIDDTDIYISSGIGTRKLNMRLFNKPSISLFRLKSLH